MIGWAMMDTFSITGHVILYYIINRYILIQSIVYKLK